MKNWSPHSRDAQPVDTVKMPSAAKPKAFIASLHVPTNDTSPQTSVNGGRHASSRLANNAKQASGKPGNDLNARRKRLAELVTSGSISESTRSALFEDIRQQVLAGSRSMRSVNFTTASAADIETIAQCYDSLFFEGNCLAIARHHGIRFRWSKRMTSAGGKTVRTSYATTPASKSAVHYEIVLSATLLFQTFGDVNRPVRVTGLLCNDRLQAMQRIVEHELIHLIEMLLWNDSCCAAPRFQSIAKRFFGHTEHKHDLITQRERADRKFNLRVGSLVSFSLNGKSYVGKVNRITRRATVLVPDQSGQLFSDGVRYRKYYVPLSHLTPAP